jgi:hypothetical protein
MRSCFEVNKQELGRMRDSHLGGKAAIDSGLFTVRLTLHPFKTEALIEFFSSP